MFPFPLLVSNLLWFWVSARLRCLLWQNLTSVAATVTCCSDLPLREPLWGQHLPDNLQMLHLWILCSVGAKATVSTGCSQPVTDHGRWQRRAVPAQCSSPLVNLWSGLPSACLRCSLCSATTWEPHYPTLLSSLSPFTGVRPASPSEPFPCLLVLPYHVQALLPKNLLQV